MNKHMGQHGIYDVLSAMLSHILSELSRILFELSVHLWRALVRRLLRKSQMKCLVVNIKERL